MKNHITFVLSIAAVAHLAAAQQTGSWGDQGDGTYKNPILEGNFPDNDVIRVGDTFYLMTSTCHNAPGMTMLKSKDLVNWQYSNPIMPAPITFDKSFDVGHSYMFNRGTWAGSFGFDGENYFAYWCYTTGGFGPNGRSSPKRMMYAKAKSMEGPWSEPKEITFADGKSINTTDPGVMWDLEKKQAWFCCNCEIYPMAWTGDKLLKSKGEGITVTKTMRGESNKLYQFGDRYYEMNTWAQGENIREQVINRARSMGGPWEGRVVLENGNGTDRCPGQGSLLKLDDGSWWFIHQLARGKVEERYDGRPQFLKPVVWQDGWPLIGTDANHNGIGEVVWQHTKPINGQPITAPATDDDFSQPQLGQQWQWSLNPKMDRWSLTKRPGYLRLKACVPLPTDQGDNPSKAEDEKNKGNAVMARLPNVLGQRLLGQHKNVMTAKCDVAGMANGQEAGLHISTPHDFNIIGVRKDSKGAMQVFFTGDGGKTETPGIALTQTYIWLQARIEKGLATFYYSLDGKRFIPLGSGELLRSFGFTPNLVGFYSMNSQEKGCFDVDWFTYDYDGPKGP